MNTLLNQLKKAHQSQVKSLVNGTKKDLKDLKKGMSLEDMIKCDMPRLR